MNRIIFFDTETTGLDATVNGIHQLAGTIVINDEVAAKFDYKINPFKGCEVDVEALKVSKTCTLDFLKYNTEVQVMFMFTQLLDRYNKLAENKQDKFILATWARDPAFDVRFLSAFLKRNSSYDVFDTYFWSNFIDVKSLASQYLIGERHKLDSFSLAPVSKYLGIAVNESQLHKASYDAYLVRKVYEVVTNTKIVDKRVLRKVKR